jgi:hypothetical protein
MAGEAKRFFSADETRREIGRDRWGRPLIRTPEGKITAYTRTSTLGKALDDETGLTKWKQRMTAIGVASRSDLVLAVNAHRNDNTKMNDLVEQGMEAAQSGAAATTGTALHDLCDQYDHGQTPYVPAEFEPDVQAYLRVTALLEVVVAEQFAVCDELLVGGTPDRVYRLLVPLIRAGVVLLPAGALVIGDIKTGKSLDFGHIAYGVQLAVYSRSQRYDISVGEMVPWGRHGELIPVGERSDWVPGEQVDQDWAVIVHVPAGGGEATLHPVDIATGWELAELSVSVREWRKRKDIIGASIELTEDFAATCATAVSVIALKSAYERAVAAGKWDDLLKQRFGKRRRELEQGATA